MKTYMFAGIAAVAFAAVGFLAIGPNGGPTKQAPSSAVVAKVSSKSVAQVRTVRLKVGNLFCASCPYIVKRTLLKTPGVIAASVSYEKKTATVTFDGARTDVPSLIRATGSVGFPSTLVATNVLPLTAD